MRGGSGIKTWSCQLYLTCEAALRDCYGCVVNSCCSHERPCFQEYQAPCFPPRTSPKETRQEKEVFIHSGIFYSFSSFVGREGLLFCKKQSLCAHWGLLRVTITKAPSALPPTPPSGEDQWFLWKKAHFPVIAYKTSWGGNPTRPAGIMPFVPSSSL